MGQLAYPLPQRRCIDGHGRHRYSSPRCSTHHFRRRTPLPTAGGFFASIGLAPSRHVRGGEAYGRVARSHKRLPKGGKSAGGPTTVLKHPAASLNRGRKLEINES